MPCLPGVFGGEGVQVLTDATITRVAYDDGQFTVSVDGQDLHFEKLLVAAGRRPNLADIGLDTVGLDPSARRRTRRADARRRETVGDRRHHREGCLHAHVDVPGGGGGARILGEDGPWADYRAVGRSDVHRPRGRLGGDDREAGTGGRVDRRPGTADLAESTRGWIAKAEGVIKLVADAVRGVLVGATAVGPSGGEILSMLVTAVHAEVPIDTMRTMIFAYPTFHRAVEIRSAGISPA